MLGLTQESAAEVLAGLLYALGFRPEESLVAGLLVNGRVQAVARFDLADVVDHPCTAAGVVLRAAAHAPMASVVLAVVTDGAPGPRPVVGEEVARGLEEGGLPCLDVLLVSGDTFAARSVAPRALDEVFSTVTAARAVSSGRALRDNRPGLLADVESGGGPVIAALAGPVDAAAVVSAWTADLAGAAAMPTAPAALLAALARPGVRDAVLMSILKPEEDDPQRLLGASEADIQALITRAPVTAHVVRATALLAALARRAEQPADALALLAWLAWWGEGDGARAAQLAERALSAHPGHRLAALTARLLDAQVPPPWRG